MAHKLDLVEDDLSFIRDHLNQERSAFKDLKQTLTPILGFLNVITTNAVPSVKNTQKTVKFSSAKPDIAESVNIGQSICSLNESEFEGLPKYLKGRLNLQKINSFIADFNRFLLEKYSILLKANPAKLTVDQRQRFFEWKSAETDETAGKFFLTETDLKSKSGNALGGFKFDQVARNILTILRQVGRIKEVRSAGIIRYVLSN